jgi:hypothetical protein
MYVPVGEYYLSCAAVEKCEMLLADHINAATVQLFNLFAIRHL